MAHGDHPQRPTRHRLLLAIGAALIAIAMAGCSSSDGSSAAETEPPDTTAAVERSTPTSAKSTVSTIPFDQLDRAECERGAKALGIAMQAAYVTTGAYPASIDETVEAGMLKPGLGYEERYGVTGGGQTKPVIEGLPEGPCTGVRFVYEVNPQGHD